MIYSWFTKDIEEPEKLAKFNAELSAPLSGRSPDKVSQEEIDDEKAQFASQM